MKMSDYRLTNRQARRFMLQKQGLIGKHRFVGKQGALAFIGQAGCIQYDPIDVCGKNAELVLQSRVKGFSKQMLYELLYEDRQLLDYFDKNLSIIRTADWPYFRRNREESRAGGKSRKEVGAVCDEIKDIIRKRGPVSSADIGFNEKVGWYWSDTRLSRAALETMYFRGDLVVHHKKGTVKHYDLAENHISFELRDAPEPHPDDFEYQKWRVLRRIGAVGLLWNRASDAWLNIHGLKTECRKRIFAELLKEDKIREAAVEGIGDKLYFLSADADIYEEAVTNPRLRKRCELIAPLDNMLWDRRLIRALFGFDYKWEIYTPEVQRKYGYYVLPILYGDRFAGRIEAVCDRKNKRLVVKNLWLEDGVWPDLLFSGALNACLGRFAEFNGCTEIAGAEKI